MKHPFQALGCSFPLWWPGQYITWTHTLQWFVPHKNEKWVIAEALEWLTGAKCVHWNRQPVFDLWMARSPYTDCSAQGRSACSSSLRYVQSAPGETWQAADWWAQGLQKQSLLTWSKEENMQECARDRRCALLQAKLAVWKDRLDLQSVSKS